VAVATGVAVVELFTSQGCSSCPPAEAVLGNLEAAAARDGRPVYTLAFHVDYWNHLGWADPFSEPAYSERQRQYARTLKLDQVYTPQMVVNGRSQFVGSDRDAADRAIADALAAPAAVRLAADIDRFAGGNLRLRYAAPGAGADAVIHVAVVEQGLLTEVKRGENAGQLLDQPSVVRWFKTVPGADHGEVAIPPLPDLRPGRASVVVFAQRLADGAVLGATAVSLP
jgi:hypothetical protein